MWERALYDCVWNLVGAVREEETDHADVAMFYEMEASEMMCEYIQIISLLLIFSFFFYDPIPLI